MSDLIEVYAGKRFEILMTSPVAKQFAKVDAKERARCLKWMRYFADDGFEYLDDQKLKNEGKFSTGLNTGTKVSIWAFKAWQLRVYGAILGGRFISTEIDASKKQDAADRRKLEAAAAKLVPYIKLGEL